MGRSETDRLAVAAGCSPRCCGKVRQLTMAPTRRVRVMALLGALVLPAPDGARAGKPDNNPCVSWKLQTSCDGAAPNVPDYIPATYSAFIWHASGTCGTPTAGGSCPACSGQPSDANCAYIFPCFADGPDVWGHRDVGPHVASIPSPCYTNVPGSKSAWQGCSGYHAGKGPDWQNFGWQVAQKGSHPSTAKGQLISHVTKNKTYVLARSPSTNPFAGCGGGKTGWVELASDGSLGCLEAAANCIPWDTCNGFEVAYCASCKPCPKKYDPNFSPGPGCPNCTKPTPAPTPVPPPPAPPRGQAACVRFGNAVPSSNSVEVTLTQGTATRNWGEVRFTVFSDWSSYFKPGPATLTIKPTAGGTTVTTTVNLTTGPQILVIKGHWPPTAASVQNIPSQFNAPSSGSAARLFNLAYDVSSASLDDASGKTLDSGVQYGAGSTWASVPATAQKFSAKSGSQLLATSEFTPPSSGEVFTAFLLGAQDTPFGHSLLAQIDAPLDGPCGPLTPPPPPAGPIPQPPTSPCIKWIKCSSTNSSDAACSKPPNLLISGHQCIPITTSPCANPVQQSACTAGPEGHAGHWDDTSAPAHKARSCYFSADGKTSTAAAESYVATAVEGHEITWLLSATGAPIPADAVYTAKAEVLVQSMATSSAAGDITTGFSEVKDSKLGPAFYDDFGGHQIGDFKVAVCKTAHPPPPPSPPPPPPPPHNDKPYIRFAMALPTNDTSIKVDCIITQKPSTGGVNVTYTWKDYGFGRFSEFIISRSNCTTYGCVAN
eukprot:COSAG05_NODE_1138_length_5750_cov_15.376747_3_plen_771_part_00